MPPVRPPEASLDSQNSDLINPLRHKGPPWTIGGTLFLGPQGWTSIRTVLGGGTSIRASTKQRRWTLLEGFNTSHPVSRGTPLSRIQQKVNCLPTANSWSENCRTVLYTPGQLPPFRIFYYLAPISSNAHNKNKIVI